MKNIFRHSSKISCFILLIFFCSSTYAQWYKQQSGTTSNLRGLWFVDSLNGWTCGDSGIILHTSNAGLQWERQNNPSTVNLEDVFFLDLYNGWIAGDSGTVINTTDGGLSWNVQQTNVTSLLHNIQFVSSRRGFASGDQATEIETYDGGLTWQIDYYGANFSLIIYWIQPGLGTSVTCNSIYGFHFCTVDSLTWFMVGQVLRPLDVCGYRVEYPYPRDYYWDVGIDGSSYWISIVEDTPAVEFILYGVTRDTLDLNAVTLERDTEPLKLWAVGNNGWIICSTDSGQNWETISSNISADLNEVAFPKENLGWAVGDSGTILRYNHPSNVHNPSPGELPSDFIVSDPYPNPFNPDTKIEYYLPQEEKVTIVVFNLLGQKVKTLLNELTSQGKHNINFDATGLPSGVYFCRLNAGKNSLTKKIVLAK